MPRVDGVSGAGSEYGDLDAVICVHTHFDHALDSALVAERTGAKLVGGTSTANVGRGHDLPDDQIVIVTPG